MRDLIDRINTLYYKSKAEGLTEEEKEEQQNLRKEYIERFRGSTKSLLGSMTFIDEDGRDVTPDGLKKMQVEEILDNMKKKNDI